MCIQPASEIGSEGDVISFLPLLFCLSVDHSPYRSCIVVTVDADLEREVEKTRMFSFSDLRSPTIFLTSPLLEALMGLVILIIHGERPRLRPLNDQNVGPSLSKTTALSKTTHP